MSPLLMGELQPDKWENEFNYFNCYELCQYRYKMKG